MNLTEMCKILGTNKEEINGTKYWVLKRDLDNL